MMLAYSGTSTSEFYCMRVSRTLCPWQPRTMEGIDTVMFASGGVPEDGLAAAIGGRVV